MVFQTVISGVIIYILGQIIQKFILEPLKEYKNVIGKIDNELKYYSNIIINSGITNNLVAESSRITRRLSCDLESCYKQIPLKAALSFCKIIPKRELISEAAKSMIRLSNVGGHAGMEMMNYEETNKIRKNLNILEI